MDYKNIDLENIWHPYTPYNIEQKNILIEKGDGAYLYDDEGNKILDAISSWWVNVYGHSHPYIAKKLNEQFLQLEHTIFAGFTHKTAIELTSRLLKKVGQNQTKLFFSDNGSTAVEVALKMAIQYFYNQGKKKNKIIAFKDAYHGDTFGAMSVSGRSIFTESFKDLLFETIYIDTPIAGEEKKSEEQLIQALKSDDVAAFIFEPLVLGAGGMMMYSPNILNNLIIRCQKNGVLCIADEVFTGFGRTGTFLATHQIEAEPDIICYSKGLTAGAMPMGITTCNEKVYLPFKSNDKLKTLFHGHSFTANPLGCSIALAGLDLYDSVEIKNGISRIVKFNEEFKKVLLEKYNGKKICNIRTTGTILAFDFVVNDNGYLSNIKNVIYNYFLSKNILIRPLGNVLYYVPPYCVSDDDLNSLKSEILLFLDTEVLRH
jgi:adenosylmethionine---8-amino-7-oxononanoate aminotransferase